MVYNLAQMVEWNPGEKDNVKGRFHGTYKLQSIWSYLIYNFYTILVVDNNELLWILTFILFYLLLILNAHLNIGHQYVL